MKSMENINDFVKTIPTAQELLDKSDTYRDFMSNIIHDVVQKYIENPEQRCVNVYQSCAGLNSEGKMCMIGAMNRNIYEFAVDDTGQGILELSPLVNAKFDNHYSVIFEDISIITGVHDNENLKPDEGYLIELSCLTAKFTDGEFIILEK